MIKVKLRELMWDRGVSSVRLSEETGIDPSTISAVIHNKRRNVGLKIIDKLCVFFNCGVSDLLEFYKE
ncbi:MAG: helix-turn-helix transcriptional regulator [Heliobacteriaceae bacterium]|jgi:DNA-binding Xre family transcriptional regulator|nr:helix-turn-helix transcriptional regulator [Heliobacteriaceae bacterium]